MNNNNYFAELKNYVPHFMNELNGLLELNQTNEVRIEGVIFLYFISRDVNENIVLAKENNKEKKFIRYCLKEKQFVDSNSDIRLVNEFYNLFISKLYSHFLSRIYNSLGEIMNGEMTFSPKESSENFCFWSVKKKAKFCLEIQKNDINGKVECLILKKIEKIPNWFVISKDENFSVVNVNRLLTFFKTESPRNNLIEKLFGNLKTDNPFEEIQAYLTPDEEFISDFCAVVNNKKDYFPYDTRKIKKC